MSLDAAFAIASGGLTNVSRQLGVVSQNVSNANTTGYTKEVGQQTAVDSGGEPMGVRTGITQRSVDAALQDESRQQDATVAALDVRSTALSAIDAAHGTPGNSNDLASLTTALSDAFSTLTSTPSLASAQSAAVTAASALTDGINRVANSITTQRQSAQDSLVDEVAQLNTSLSTIGTLATQIQNETNAGESTATLEDQRDAAEETVAKLTGANFQQQ
ncbi:FlgK family flagellar hook-associated protein, partial [Telmatospirillum sp.]|uniref:FlgK family flagellar hook-associated protein n=1 Tax=Telmatospirillum sp. TaxID=2079197 RepID=UPI00283C1E56